MANDNEPTHLNNHHQDTLDRILQHPASHNMQWHDVVSLLEAVGEVKERHDGHFVVTVGAETEVFDRPRHKDIDVQMIVDLRRMLTNAGYTAGKPGKEV
jgi:thiamine biosynthesis lipoprotein ApbE